MKTENMLHKKVILEKTTLAMHFISYQQLEFQKASNFTNTNQLCYTLKLFCITKH